MRSTHLKFTGEKHRMATRNTLSSNDLRVANFRLPSVYSRWSMPNAEREFIRDGSRRIIGSVTTGYSDTSAVVRGEGNRIEGRTSGRFHTTRDSSGKLVSINSADPGLLIRKKWLSGVVRGNRLNEDDGVGLA